MHLSKAMCLSLNSINSGSETSLSLGWISLYMPLFPFVAHYIAFIHSFSFMPILVSNYCSCTVDQIQLVTNSQVVTNMVLTVRKRSLTVTYCMFQVCEFAIKVTNGENKHDVIPIANRQQILQTWVLIRQMLQMQINKTMGTDDEVSLVNDFLFLILTYGTYTEHIQCLCDRIE